MFDRYTYIAFSLFLAALVGVISLGVVDHINKKHQQEKMQTECIIISKMAGGASQGIGLSSNGKVTAVTTFESDKTGYLCKDGIVHWIEE